MILRLRFAHTQTILLQSFTLILSLDRYLVEACAAAALTGDILVDPVLVLCLLRIQVFVKVFILKLVVLVTERTLVSFIT
jgi:hypothetical protein